MEERSAILMGALVGALAGGAVGYLYFTESGRRVREQLEPRMNDVIAELQRARIWKLSGRTLYFEADGRELLRFRRGPAE